MKNFALPVVLLFFSASFLHAQTEKGAFALGLHNFSPSGVLSSSTAISRTNLLGFSFGTAKEKVDGNTQEGEIKYSIVGLNFDGHYFVIDNFSLGLGLNFYSQNEKEDDGFGGEDESTSTIFMAGPELRYYITTGAKTKVWFQGVASFGSAKSKYNGESGDPINLSQYGGSAGLAYFPNPHFSIDLGLGYNTFKAKSDDDFFGTIEEIYSGLAFDIGFGVFF